MKQREILQRPWWRSHFWGYFFSLPLILVAVLVPILEKFESFHDYFIGALCFVVTALIGLLWGVGPALFSIVLSVLGLDYFVIPPTGILDFYTWSDTISFLPFIVAQLFVLLLIVLREKDHLRLRFAEEDARMHAQKLADSNQALVESNSQLEEADHLKDQFISQASHELKTPITTIRGQAQFALRRLSKQCGKPVDEVTMYTHLKKIEIQTLRLHTLINDLLDLSSFKSGKIPLHFAMCDLVHLCDEIIADQSIVYDRCINLEKSCASVFIQADDERLSQVIINLVTNAIKYSPENTVIQIAVSQDELSGCLSVHNDGSAISQEQQRNIFEPFYRTPDARSSSKQGWGLGLAISKDIVERHGGQIWVTSTEATGTTFFVKVPIFKGPSHSEL